MKKEKEQKQKKKEKEKMKKTGSRKRSIGTRRRTGERRTLFTFSGEKEDHHQGVDSQILGNY